MRRLTAKIAVPLILLPLLPFYALDVAAAWTTRKIQAWRWPERIIDVADRVHLWSLQ